MKKLQEKFVIFEKGDFLELHDWLNLEIYFQASSRENFLLSHVLNN